MGDCIETVIEGMEKELVGLREISRLFPGCTARHYDNITIWVVDMPVEECDQVRMVNKADLRDLPGREVRGYVLLFKNMAQGVNIAPRNHHFDLKMFIHQMRDRPKAMEEVVALFREHG